MSLSRLPLPDPGVPDLRSGLRYLLWVARGQWRILTIGTTWGIDGGSRAASGGS